MTKFDPERTNEAKIRRAVEASEHARSQLDGNHLRKLEEARRRLGCLAVMIFVAAFWTALVWLILR